MKIKIPTTPPPPMEESEVLGCYSIGANYLFFTESACIDVFDGLGYKNIVFRGQDYAPADIGKKITEKEFMDVYERVISHIESEISELHHELHFQVITQNDLSRLQ